MISYEEVIKIPAGIRYLGNWSDFKFSNFPDRCILDKELPGCGFTEYCTNGDENVILASPRIMLINNKADQHPNVFLVVNEMDKDPGVDKDLSRDSKDFSKELTQEEKERKETELELQRSAAYKKIKSELISYINKCFIENRPMKILVTYDSYHIVKNILINEGLFNSFYTIVDEFQSILHDSRFKSTTEMQFLNNLLDVQRVMFASATPMMKDYINMLNEFDGLPYFTLDWGSEDPSRIIKPDLEVRSMKTTGMKAKEIIQTYLDGNFESVIVRKESQTVKVQSTEAVFYVNSVNHIISIIKKSDLQPNQVLILCSNTPENKKKIRNRLTSKFSIGHVPNPKKGEKFPMFTFCTRTVYLGADFYSKCARTFIFSDSNIDSLAVDISEDLPQILGRQRLDENPWKNSATFFYRTTANYRKMTKEDFDKILKKKKEKTEALLKAYKDSKENKVKVALAETYQDLAKLKNYKDDYVGVNIIYNGKVRLLIPKVNMLVYINELRAFDIQQEDYKNRFTVFNKIKEQMNINDIISDEVSLFLQKYEQLTTRYDKLKLLCESGLSQDAINLFLSQISDSDEIKSYYVTLGPKRLYELGYSITKIRKELGIVVFDKNLLKDEILKQFHVGDRLLLMDIKDKLKTIYQSINYESNPTASDLLEYFEVKDFTKSIINPKTGKKKRASGYELLLIKS